MVTICKFFLTNSCKFGDKCRYSHVIPNDNPYVYDARSTNSNKDEVERLLPEYLKKVAEDTNQIEQQKMWPLTCYSFVKSQGNLPEWNDVSMEELRWEAYKAQKSGNLEIYIVSIQKLLMYAKEVRDKYMRPSKETETILREYMKGKNKMTVSSNQNVPFLMNSSFKTQNNFSFASAFENQQPSMFNQATNSNSSGFFTQNAQPNNTFNQTAQVSQPFFGIRNSFETSQPANDIFRNAQLPQNNIFNIETTSNSFTSTPMQFSTSMPIQTTMQVTNKTDQTQIAFKSNENITYSKVEELSKEDYEAFKAPTFTLENLPYLPPPKELCH